MSLENLLLGLPVALPLVLAAAPPPRQAPDAPLAVPTTLTFEENRGQYDDAIRFVCRGRAQRVLVGAGDVAIGVGGEAWLRVTAGAPVAVSGEGALATQSHHLRGADSAGWVAGAPHYAQVRLASAWPGVDLVLHEADGRLELLLELAPGADAGGVELAVEGAGDLRVGADGALELSAGGSALSFAPPVAWQGAGAERRGVEVRYETRGARRFGFAVGASDPTRGISIDPVLVYSTYVGGSGFDDARAVAVDDTGAVLVAGSTTSPGLAGPGTAPAGGRDAFVAKLSPDGGALQWITYLGGAGAGLQDDEAVFAIALDAAGRPVVCGSTNSADFPLVSAAQPVHGGGDDGFVAKLSADGAGLVWSTYLGGSSYDSARSLVVQADGGVTVGGATSSSDLPLLAPLQASYAGGNWDGMLARYTAGGQKLATTYLGGQKADAVNAVELDSHGRIVIAGLAQSADFPPATPGEQGFFARLAADLGSIELLESFPATVTALGVDALDRIYLGGTTTSFCLPVTFGAYQTSHSGSAGYTLDLDEVFLCRFDSAGQTVERCTYYGSSLKGESLSALEIAPAGDVFLSLNSSGAASGTAVVGRIAAFDPELTQLAFASVIGSDATVTWDLALAPGGDVVAAGSTTNGGFATPGAAQTVYGGVRDGWVRRYAPIASHVVGLSLSTTRVTHGGSLEGVVVLDGLAPAGGAQVALAASDPLIAVPPAVLVPAGTLAATFQLDAGMTSAAQTVEVQASWNATVSDVVEVWHGPFHDLADAIASTGGPYFDKPVGSALDADDRIAFTRSNKAYLKEPGQPEVQIPGATQAIDIQDGGDVLVKLSGTATGLYDGTTVTPVSTLEGAQAISAGGAICGHTSSGPWLDPAGAAAFFLPAIPSGTSFGHAHDVNASDWVVGFWQSATFDHRAYLYRPGLGTLSLGTLLGGSGSSGANAVNDAGEVVGWSHAQSGTLIQTHGFLWDAERGMLDLPPLPGDSTSRAIGVSGGGRPVGSSDNTAVVWDESLQPIELGATLDPAVAFRKGFARAIAANASGSVLVEGRIIDDNCGTGSIDTLYRFVPSGPSWSVYGSGWPGTTGVPSIGLAGDPVLCTTVTLQVGNSSGAPAPAFLFVGTAPASIPTAFGPTQLVANPIVVPVGLAPDGVSLPVTLPCDPSWQDTSLFVQAAVLDPGASAGVAATAGLEMRLR